jgi:predicted Zn-dependent peptidase
MVRSAQNEIHFNRIIRLPEVIKKIEAVTAAEILELSKSLFENNKMSLTLLGPVKDETPFEDILFT